MEDGMEDFWYGMEWKISGVEWNCMEDGRFTFHSIVCPACRWRAAQGCQIGDSWPISKNFVIFNCAGH